MKRFGLVIIAATMVTLLGWVSPAQGTPITYRQSTIASGTIGGNAFTNALVNVQLTGDTSNVALAVAFPSPFNSLLESPGTGTINIAGIGAATFTDPFVILSSFNTLYQGPPINGEPFVLSATLDNPQGTDFTGVLITLGPAFLGYDLRTPLGPISGSGGTASGQLGVHHTTLGDLLFSNTQPSPQTSTFSATVPETSSLVLLSTGLVALVGARFRRRRGARL